MKFTLRSLLGVVGLAALTLSHPSQEIRVGGPPGWQSGIDYVTIEAAVGDTLVFEFGVIHDVWQMPDTGCNFSSTATAQGGRAQLLADHRNSPYKHVLGEKGELFFACSVSNHCQRGQKVKVVVVDHEHPDCEDDGEGNLKALGFDCAMLLQFIGGDCEVDINTKMTIVPKGWSAAKLCPLSCGGCEPEEGGESEERSMDPTDRALAMNPNFCNPQKCDLEALDVGDGSMLQVTPKVMGICRAGFGTKACADIINGLYACADPSSLTPLDKEGRDKVVNTLQTLERYLLNVKRKNLDPNVSGNFYAMFGSATNDPTLSDKEREEKKTRENKEEKERRKKAGLPKAKGFGYNSMRNDEGYCEDRVEGEDGVFTVKCRSAPLEMYPGAMIDVVIDLVNPFPDYPVEQTENFGRLVNENMEEIPLNDVYIHHFVSNIIFGAGSENAREGIANHPDPYVYVRFPHMNRNTFTNFHYINTVGVEKKDFLACIECWCLEGEVPTGPIDAEGGITCCKDCPVSIPHKNLTYYFLYDVSYREFNYEEKGSGKIPLHLTMYNVADRIEYNVDVSEGVDGVHTLTKLTTIDYSNPQDKTMKIFGCYGHQHIGGLGLEVYDEVTGDLICKVTPQYGTNGRELGNEEGYLVKMEGMSYYDAPKSYEPGHPIRLVSKYGADIPHMGVMALIYIWYEGDMQRMDEAIEMARVPLSVKLPSCMQNSPLLAKDETSSMTALSEDATALAKDELLDAKPSMVRDLHHYQMTEDSVSLMWMEPEAATGYSRRAGTGGECQAYSYKLEYSKRKKNKDKSLRNKVGEGPKWVSYEVQAGNTGVVVSGLAAGTKYDIRVTPVTINGVEGESTSVSVKTGGEKKKKQKNGN